MIKSEPLYGRPRWHCTDCDARGGPNFCWVRWTWGEPPEFCARCERQQEYRIKLDLNVLLPETNSVDARHSLDVRKRIIEDAIRDVLGGRDAKLNNHTVSRATRRR